MAKPRKCSQNPSARFTQSQLSRLQSAYAGIKHIAPNGPGYARLSAHLNSMTQPQLKQLADAGINFMSKLARNRIRK